MKDKYLMHKFLLGTITTSSRPMSSAARFLRDATSRQASKMRARSRCRDQRKRLRWVADECQAPLIWQNCRSSRWLAAGDSCAHGLVLKGYLMLFPV